MLTIRPPLRVTMAWRTVCVVLRTPFRFTAINRSQRAGSLSTKKWSRSQPALLTRTSIGPSSASTAATAQETASRSATSAVAGNARPPAARTSAAPASAVSGSTSTIPIARPSRARRCAMARPMPRPAPVTSATEPTPLPAARQRRREAAAHGDLALLVDGLHLAIDPPLAVGLVLARHFAHRDDRVAGPDARREADLQAAQAVRADEVRHAAADERGRQHAVAKHARLARHVRELLVVMDRVEVARGARVAHEVRPAEVLHHDGRELLAFRHVLEVARHAHCTAPSVWMRVLRLYAATSPRWLVNSVSVMTKSIFPPRLPSFSKTSFVRPRAIKTSPGRIGRRYSNSCSPWRSRR